MLLRPVDQSDFPLQIQNKKNCDNQYNNPRGTSMLGEVRNGEIPEATQQLLNGKFHDFLAVFPRAHSKINLNCKIFE